MKQQKLMTDLENSIYHLKEEIQELKLQRQLIYYGVPTFTNIWGVATEFFRLFRNSVQPPTLLAGSRGEYDTQENFLRATMTSDVTDGIVCGVDALLDTWSMQSVCYQDIDLQPVRMYNVPNDSMVATTKGRLTINENTLRFAFPHLITESEKWSDLTIKMLGQQLELHGYNRISIDYFPSFTACRLLHVETLLV
ncbi:hypothetical protein PHPALM_31294 [Phytophthora palmivora]|uniref:Bzip transcription factor n=1 Tax=Phytophthora palmivora TaxID=4796 RepID=A0A2P4X2Z2_9STRA|nr:hypothetical protein PHPALM_31294 [Phytophthora palmivora]